MPELPEVEIVVRGLRRTVVGKTIERVTLEAPPSSIVVSKSFGGADFESILRNKTIHRVARRGKNILISLDDNITLWVHLKMTGHFFYLRKAHPRHKHDLVVFDFVTRENYRNAKHLRFHDPRRFGRLRLFHDHELWEQDGLRELGPEPLEVSESDFVNLFKKTHRMIKPALLDQSFLAGLGNIYADESLFLSRIHPQRLTSRLSQKKLLELRDNIQIVLQKAIKLMGTSIVSYSGVDGRVGKYQDYLQVYGKEALPCPSCGAPIRRKRIGSRSAHFCPRCQRQR